MWRLVSDKVSGALVVLAFWIGAALLWAMEKLGWGEN